MINDMFIISEEALKMEFPVLFSRKDQCCGCTACFSICPIEAIIMEPDEEGFEYPVINYEKCVKCNLCLKVCPLK